MAALNQHPSTAVVGNLFTTVGQKKSCDFCKGPHPYSFSSVGLTGHTRIVGGPLVDQPWSTENCVHMSITNTPNEYHITCSHIGITCTTNLLWQPCTNIHLQKIVLSKEHHVLGHHEKESFYLLLEERCCKKKWLPLVSMLQQIINWCSLDNILWRFNWRTL